MEVIGTKEGLPWLPTGFQHLHKLITMLAHAFHVESNTGAIALLRGRVSKAVSVVLEFLLGIHGDLFPIEAELGELGAVVI